MDKRKKGALQVFFAAVLWSFAGICTKYVPWGAFSIACVRGVLSAATIGVVTGKWFFKLNPAIVLGALGTAGTSILFMMANKITTAANAIVMQYTAPVFIILLSIVFLKKKPSRMDVLAVLVTLGGISLFFIEHLGYGAILGDILGILSGITFGMMFFVNRMPGADPMKASYLGCLLHIVLLPLLIFDKSIRNFDMTILLVMIAMGILQMGMAYVLFSRGIRHTHALPASIISMMEPILNPVWVFIVMGEGPGPLAITGGIIVITTIVCYSIYSGRKAAFPQT